MINKIIPTIITTYTSMCYVPIVYLYIKILLSQIFTSCQIVKLYTLI